MRGKLIEFKLDLVFTEKGISGLCTLVIKAVSRRVFLSDLAQHYFLKANISVLRRVRKSDNNRIARAVRATIVNHIEDLRSADVGLFNIEKICDE